LRNTALALLAAGDPVLGSNLARAQFEHADNMTDRLAALGVLGLVPGAAREDALARFYADFQHQALVVDKWFALQASIPEPATVDRVKTLMEHPAFSWAVPNRVYALIGAFGANATQFHRRDGFGYDLVADAVIRLDGTNPQVASRILGSFRSWRIMEPVRRGHAEAALQRIGGQKTLSPDVKDLAGRSLRR
jgi:aminopeptidase N